MLDIGLEGRGEARVGAAKKACPRRDIGYCLLRGHSTLLRRLGGGRRGGGDGGGQGPKPQPRRWATFDISVKTAGGILTPKEYGGDGDRASLGRHAKWCVARDSRWPRRRHVEGRHSPRKIAHRRWAALAAHALAFSAAPCASTAK